VKNVKQLMRILTVITVGASLASPAGADDAFESGDACQPASGVTASDIGYSDTGVLNWSGAQRNVTCPMPRHSLTSSATFGWTTLYYADYSSSSEFMCAFFGCSGLTGSCGWSSTKWTCATDQGCYSPTSVSAGIVGRLSFPGGTIVATGNTGFSCTMAGDTGLGPSSVLAHRSSYW
jgi:hypothetical protein